MTLIALALDGDTEDRLLADIVEHGHVIVARPANVPELLAAIDRYSPEALIVGGTPGTLTPELLAASDSAGIRVVALVATEEERRYVAGLGLHEVARADAEWVEIETVLTLGSVIPLRIEDAPGPEPDADAPSPDGATFRERRRPRSRADRRPRAQPRRRVRRAEAGASSGASTDAQLQPRSQAQSSTHQPPAHQPPAVAGLTGTGTVIAVWGPAGSPGRTTLAINIAAEIAAAGHSVVLADVDTYSGSIAPGLGLLDEAPGFAAACRLAGTDALTPAEVDRIAHRYNSPRGAFRVLTGIGRPSRWPELSADRVGRTIAVLRGAADYVILDTGFSLESDEEISSDLFAPRRNAATLAALESADRVVACGLADPVGLARFLRVWADLTDTITTHRVLVVINRVRSSAVGLGAGNQVVSALRRFGGIEAAALVPHDQQGLDSAVLTGRTLRDAAPRSPARLSIRAFVHGDLLPAPDDAPGRRFAWMRPARWRGTAAAT